LFEAEPKTVPRSRLRWSDFERRPRFLYGGGENEIARSVVES
jgi:hypothetical protein